MTRMAPKTREEVFDLRQDLDVLIEKRLEPTPRADGRFAVWGAIYRATFEDGVLWISQDQDQEGALKALEEGR